MEFQFPSLLLLVSFIPLSIFILLKHVSIRFKTRKLPPGPCKFPLIGNMHNLIGSHVPHRTLYQLAMKHGPVMHLQLGELSVVVVSSPDAAKQVMKTHDKNLASRPPILAAEIVSYGCTGITFAPLGDYWRQLRKICTLELLSEKRVQSLRSLREEVFTDLIMWIASMEGSPVNLTEKINSSLYDLITTAAVGNISKGREALLSIMKEVFGLAAGFDIAELYPSMNLLRMISRLRRRLSVLHREADRILDGIIHEHKAANAVKKLMGDDERKKHEDLVDVLLKFQEEGLEIPLTNDNIKSVILDILGGGSESSATTIDWAMAELLKNPRVMAKAQNEVRQVYDKKGYVDESCIHELKYLKAVIKETLRVHIPGPLLLPRRCSQTCEINGYEIPVGTKIIVNAWAISRDPKYWKDAECFQPERFLDNSVDFKGNHFEYIPFGAGRRICPGISFALANVELLIAMLLYHFDWNLPVGMKDEEIDMKEGFGMTARRVKELSVIPVIKRPLSLAHDT